MMNKNEFLSLPKAAEKCGVDRRTMWRWVKAHKISSFVTPGGHHRILRSEVEGLLENRSISKNSRNTEKTILVIDDDKSVLKILKKRITEANYHVETASKEFEAGMKAMDIKPDLIILDPMMAGLDGFEICRTIKESKLLNGVKILIFSQLDTPESQGRAIEGGVDGYLPKDVDLSLLVQKVDTLLKK
jgi:excisionase family DNA binding protein